MKTLIVFLTGLLFLGGAQASAAENAPPWTEAQATLESLEADLQRGGIQTVGAYTDSVEILLAAAGQAAVMHDNGNQILVLTDGPTEALAAMLLVTAGERQNANPRGVSAVRNPYPPLALYVGAYYNENGSYTDALRILEAGIALPRMVPGSKTGEHLPLLTTERGAALMALMRWPEALAAYDEGLSLPDLSAMDRARILRGRGFSLIELDRLDEAAEAYRDSLESEPDNPIALRELSYIEGLRAGGEAAPPQIFAPGLQPQQ